MVTAGAHRFFWYTQKSWNSASVGFRRWSMGILSPPYQLRRRQPLAIACHLVQDGLLLLSLSRRRRPLLVGKGVHPVKERSKAVMLLTGIGAWLRRLLTVRGMAEHVHGLLAPLTPPAPAPGIYGG